jgi:ATP-binding cassette subfamily B multidrug efflux pump
MSNDNKSASSAMGGTRNSSMRIVSKPKNFKQSWLKILKFCRPHRFPIAISIFLAIAASVITIISPNQLQEMTNLITKGIRTNDINLKSITNIAIILLALYVISYVLGYMQSWMMASIAQKITVRMRGNLSSKQNRLPLKYFDNTSYGQTLSTLTNDVDSINDTFSQNLVSIIVSVCLFVGITVVMFITQWVMALLALFSSIIGFIIMFIIVSRSQKYFAKQQAAIGSLNGHIEEKYSSQILVRMFNARDIESKKFETKNDDLHNYSWRAQFFSGIIMPIMGFIGNLGYVMVVVSGCLLVINGNIDFGVIIAFMIYIRLFSQPLSQIAQSVSSLQTSAASAERVFELLEQEEMASEDGKFKLTKKLMGEINFSNVCFGYTKERNIIDNFNVMVAKGNKIAIVGPTGAGKTTIVNLLMRFYEISSGKIEIDGVDISTITKDDLRKNISMVLQDTWVFNGTLRENIVYNTSGVSQEDLDKVCLQTGLKDYISTLPNGYETILDDNSALSSGQRQLITIARAMIKNSSILILDEATSSVDTRTEKVIQESMDKLMHGRTSFVIAHRLSTIKNADIILVIKNGNIVESGNHLELIAKKNGDYSQLYNSQFEG